MARHVVRSGGSSVAMPILSRHRIIPIRRERLKTYREISCRCPRPESVCTPPDAPIMGSRSLTISLSHFASEARTAAWAGTRHSPNVDPLGCSAPLSAVRPRAPGSRELSSFMSLRKRRWWWADGRLLRRFGWRTDRPLLSALNGVSGPSFSRIMMTASRLRVGLCRSTDRGP